MATKYCRADGIASWANANGPESSASDCCSLSTAGSNASAGDTVYISGLGGVFRDTLTPSNSGSSGSPITFSGLSSAKICGADLCAGWSDQGGNIWRATWNYADADHGIWMDSQVGDRKTSGGSLVNEYDYYFNDGSNYIEIYSPSDPDTRYTDPGVEVARRWQTFNAYAKSYITVENIEFGQTVGDCVRFRSSGSNITLTGCKFWGGGGGLWAQEYHDGILIEDYDDVLVSECEAYDNAWNGIANHNNGNGTTSNITVEKCYIHGNGHNGADTKTLSTNSDQIQNVTYRYNRVTGQNEHGLMIFSNDNSDGYINGALVIGNVSYENGYWGIYIAFDSGGSRHNDIEVIGNTFWKNGARTTWGGGIWASATASVFKNNIVGQSQHSGSAEIGTNDGGGAANTIDYNLVYHSTKTDFYEVDGTDYTHTEMKSAGHQTNAPDPADPLFTDADSGDFTLQSNSPAIGAGENLGASYDDALMPESTWPDGVVTGDQDSY